MNHPLGITLTPRKKAALAILALAAVVAPLAVGLVNAPARGQSSSSVAANNNAHLPSYDVISVKPNDTPGITAMAGDPPGAFTATHVSIDALIMAAYDVASFQISADPQWAHSQAFDIEARADDSTTKELVAMGPSERKAQNRLMLQSLLADRFKLVVHDESREMPVYALVPARGGLKLSPPQEGSCVEPSELQGPLADPQSRMQPPSRGLTPAGTCGSLGVTLEAAGARMRGRKVPMVQFARVLSRVFGRMVIDRTGFTGMFDVDLEFLPDEATPGLPAPPPGSIPDATASASIFSAVQQLGLRLESSRGPVEVLVVDHVQQPSAN